MALRNNNAVNGYQIRQFGGTVDFEQDGSASMDPVQMLIDNNNTGTPKKITGTGWLRTLARVGERDGH